MLAEVKAETLIDTVANVKTEPLVDVLADMVAEEQAETPKNSNHLRSHLTSIKALDHSRLGLENKYLESKSGRIFSV